MVNKNKIGKFVGTLVILSFVTLSESFAVKLEDLPESCQKKEASFEESMACAQSTFTVKGDPINPRIIEELMTELSDSGDQIVSIDLLSSQNSNRFFVPTGKMSVEQTGKFFKVTYTDPKCMPLCQFSYEVQGVTDGGVYVLTTTSDAGGSGVFNSLVLVKIKEDEGTGIEKTLQGASSGSSSSIPLKERLLIEKLGEAALGDRSVSGVKVVGDKIEINNKSSQGQMKSVILELPK